MQSTKIWLVILSLGFGAVLPVVPAAKAATEFDYPELSVTPRASDRVESEAAKESQRRMGVYAPFFISSGMTFMTGLFTLGSKKNPDDIGTNYAPVAGLVVGGAWFVLTGALYTYYEPYASAQKELATMGKKSTRESLTRERYAEERIAAAAKMSQKLKWMSFLSNAAVGGYMIGKVAEGSLGQVMAGATIVGSLAPFIFRPYWEDIASSQTEYKKRIYSPVASVGFLPTSQGDLVPGLSLALRF